MGKVEARRKPGEERHPYWMNVSLLILDVKYLINVSNNA